MRPKFKSAIVIGAGAFGTSIASVLSNNFEKVYLKVRSQDIYDALKEGENKIYLPGVELPINLTPIMDWGELEKVEEVELVVSGLPTKALNSYFREHKDFFENYLKKGIPFVSLAKGIDTETLELPDDIFYDIFYDYKDNFCFLSGPSFAKEIVEKQITMVSIAGRTREHLEKVLEMLKSDYFKGLPTYDVKGVLLGGALKNILAIASGMIEGFGYNHNTRAAMITRGIVEMLRFGKVFNAREETFYGLSGMGDLILTTTGELSRNKSFGLEIAKGRKPLEIIESQRSVVEGYKTTEAAYFLSERFKIRTQLFNGVYEILYKDRDPKEIMDQLMALPIKFES